MPRVLALDGVEVLIHRVGRAKVPVVAHALLRGQDLDELAQLFRDHAPGLSDVAVEREGFVLRRDEDPPQAGVDAVAEGEIDDAVGPAEVDRWFGPLLRQRIEPFTNSAGQHDDEGVFQHRRSPSGRTPKLAEIAGVPDCGSYHGPVTLSCCCSLTCRPPGPMIEGPEPASFRPSAKNETLVRGLIVLLLLAVPAVAAPTAQTKKSTTDPAQQAEIAALVTAVDDLMAGKVVASSLPVKWEQEHFLKAEAGKTYMPVHARHRSAALCAFRPGRRLRSCGEEGERGADGSTDARQRRTRDAPPPSPYPFDQIVFVNPEPAERWAASADSSRAGRGAGRLRDLRRRSRHGGSGGGCLDADRRRRRQPPPSAAAERGKRRAGCHQARADGPGFPGHRPEGKQRHHRVESR